MPGDEYASATGGSLKLKGVNSSSKITKKKKKRPKSPKESPERTEQRSKSEDRSKPAEEDREVESDALAQQDSNAQNEVEDDTALRNRGKTEAEIRHEERRRRRLDERLKREGTKTHKERVEELNRYLSNLSEHHDMPRIGPG